MKRGNLRLGERIDLPGHDIVIRQIRGFIRAKMWVNAVSAAVVWLYVFDVNLNVKTATPSDITIFVEMLAISVVLSLISGGDYLHDFADTHSGAIKKYAVALALLAGLINYKVVAVPSAATTVLLAAGVGIAVVFGLRVLDWAIKAFLAVGLALTWPALWFGARLLQYYFRVAHPEWRTRTGKPIFEFGWAGINDVNADGSQIFVRHPHMRRNGVAADAGFEKYSWGEMYFRHGFRSMPEAPVHRYNPSRGGQDEYVAVEYLINPASGLPLINSMQDVMGNTFGTKDHAFHQ